MATQSKVHQDGVGGEEGLSGGASRLGGGTGVCRGLGGAGGVCRSDQ